MDQAESKGVGIPFTDCAGSSPFSQAVTVGVPSESKEELVLRMEALEARLARLEEMVTKFVVASALN